MEKYKREGVFRTLPPGFILTERKTPVSPVRRGIVLAVDLEAYSYEQKSDALIRATEATITERIPPRLKIRESALFEFPHIMVLYNDPQDTVLGPYRNAPLETLYDFDLNMGGGHIRGKFFAGRGADDQCVRRIGQRQSPVYGRRRKPFAGNGEGGVGKNQTGTFCGGAESASRKVRPVRGCQPL